MKISKSEYQGLDKTEQSVELTSDQLLICKKYNIDFVDIIKLFSNDDIPMWFQDIKCVRGREKEYWNLCEELLGNFGEIKEHTNVDSIYHYNSENGYFYLSDDKIWSVFETKFNMKSVDIQELTTLYIENRYNLKGICTTTIKTLKSN